MEKKKEEEEDISSLSESLRLGFADIIKSGNFKKNSKIGKGSYGQVYVSEYEGKTVAAKKMKINRVSYNRIKREIMILSKLKHRNIVDFEGVIMKKESTLFYMTELMEGGNLGGYLKKILGQLGSFSKNMKKVFPLAQRMSYCTQILDGLSYVHKHGVIHRDIKLENILLSKDMKVAKICDFGFARPIGAEFSLKEIDDTDCTWATILANSIAGHLKRENKRGEWLEWKDDGISGEDREEEEFEKKIPSGPLPRRKTVIGTPLYMAPEIFTQIYDTTVDVYAYGVLAVNILTVRYHLKLLAARDMEMDSILEAQATEGVPLDRRTINKMESENISTDIIDLFSLCLSVTPQQRPNLAKIRNSFVRCLLDLEKENPAAGEWILDEYRKASPLPEPSSDDFFSDTPTSNFASLPPSSGGDNPLQQTLVCFVQKKGAKGFLDMLDGGGKGGMARGGSRGEMKGVGSPSRFNSPACPVFNWNVAQDDVPDVLLLAERMGAVGFLGLTGGERAPTRPNSLKKDSPEKDSTRWKSSTNSSKGKEEEKEK